MSATLKECPFCGNPPRYLAGKSGFYSERVICDTCDFWMTTAAWDKRPAIAPPVAAGSVDTESRKLAVKFDKEAREQRQRAEKAEAERDVSLDRVEQLKNTLREVHGYRDEWERKEGIAQARVAELEQKIADLDVQARDEEDRQAAHE